MHAKHELQTAENSSCRKQHRQHRRPVAGQQSMQWLLTDVRWVWRHAAVRKHTHRLTDAILSGTTSKSLTRLRSRSLSCDPRPDRSTSGTSCLSPICTHTHRRNCVRKSICMHVAVGCTCTHLPNSVNAQQTSCSADIRTQTRWKVELIRDGPEHVMCRWVDGEQGSRNTLNFVTGQVSHWPCESGRGRGQGGGRGRGQT